MGMTTNELSALAACILSLSLTYVPGLRHWYAGLSAEGRAGGAAASIVLAAMGAFIAGCAGIVGTIDCTQQGWQALLQSVISALAASQSLYMVTRRIAPARRARDHNNISTTPPTPPHTQIYTTTGGEKHLQGE